MAEWTDRITGVGRAIDHWCRRHALAIGAGTLLSTAALLALGWYTAAIGAGATCNATYPGCAGQLSPIGLSVPQFVEWLHRFVAMFVGYAILGNAIVQWRAHTGTRISRSAGLAALLLPLQVVFGAATVTIAGLLPGGYAPPTQILHLAAALGIFVSLVASIVWLDIARGAGPTARRLTYAAAGGISLAALQLAVARGGALTFRPLVQTTHHLVAIGQLAAFLTLAIWAREIGRRRLTALAGGGAVLSVATIALVVGVVPITRPIELLAMGLIAIQGALFVTMAYSGGDGPVETPAQTIEIE
ncbi:COX15/CtaA family protein [Halococcoides cellulosivorans]|uniref:Cytochrome oxidase assembly protein n=1 Tax=Halococcoides cellulosivorans TaxID=1679096 RepID=A0A2R4X113_9EURY|nr:COX15/CtaA family protein [Halococcoides cellulosivorans]AWB27466.1 hypothetical protein HARCEL1_06975 [Halococcoides cellulosivorans]